MSKKQHLDEKHVTLGDDPVPAPAGGTVNIPPAPGGVIKTSKAGDVYWPLEATVVGHANASTIKDTNKSLGAPRALMHVPAARAH